MEACDTSCSISGVCGYLVHPLLLFFPAFRMIVSEGGFVIPIRFGTVDVSSGLKLGNLHMESWNPGEDLDTRPTWVILLDCWSLGGEARAGRTWNMGSDCFSFWGSVPPYSNGISLTRAERNVY
ncbi:hypothetical protein P152DRAFT_454943 [Eremomyces bilateralis CBS 781.70]|uniref:Uncharacterized protein n=1 Tax=Eremomyces bilateralis CBS 781.70 TaxID=1392243 RepID=A0A6G1GF59_9PEZI|nr:uncharacterized protein P152DRAFT_454943 [Eremomyces bilateralis CBS 781.70]KAF1816717.1 hypothetical protein P152DRAFT_454943 [Eremomyces bilateralis CBS 781.70]